MKGIIRGGIRYISHMFDEKEPEMEIGNPTDVKHVAHIGFEGPDASKPSWMNDYHKSAPELENGNADSMEQAFSAAASPKSTTDTNQAEKPKHRSRRPSGGGSPGRKSTDGTKHSKRSAAVAGGSPVSSSPKQNRRYRNMMSPKNSPARDPSSIPKHSRPRKSKKDKNSSKDGSEASSEPKVKKSYAGHLSSVLEVYDEEEKQLQQHTDSNSPNSNGLMAENPDFLTADAKTECVGVY